jgi:hypothetical protein
MIINSLTPQPSMTNDFDKIIVYVEENQQPQELMGMEEPFQQATEFEDYSKIDKLVGYDD